MALTTLLVVSDVERSRDWYVDVLGASLYRAYEGSCVLQLLEHWVVLVPGGGPTEDKPTIEFAPPASADRVSAEFIFRVPDCHGAYQELSRRGAEFLTPPVDHGYEIRAFFRDPDGHLFEISEVGGGTGSS
jgi:catechol 2,3-dioxygenase-like lactoylglutathione lyase family enzyme